MGSKWRWGLAVLVLSLTTVTGVSLARAGEQELTTDQQREAELLRVVGPAFTLKRTPHFLVAFDTSRALVDDLTSRLELTYQAVHRFCKVISFDPKLTTDRLEVIFFDKQAEYDRYAAQMSFPSAGTYGFYHELTHRSAFFNVLNDPQFLALHASVNTARASLARLQATMDQIRDRRTPVEVEFQDGRRARLTKAQVEREVASARRELETLDGQRAAYCGRINQTVVQHEVAHHVLFSVGLNVRGAGNPRWLVEGLACLFETPPDMMGSSFYAINQLRLKDFRAAVAGGATRRQLAAEDFLTAVADGRMVPLPRLISDPALFNARGQRAVVYYAAAWGLTHYLQRVHTAALAGYLKAVAARPADAEPSAQEETELFEAHFGPLDQTFAERFSNYILKLPCHALAGDL